MGGLRGRRGLCGIDEVFVSWMGGYFGKGGGEGGSLKIVGRDCQSLESVRGGIARPWS